MVLSVHYNESLAYQDSSCGRSYNGPWYPAGIVSEDVGVVLITGSVVLVASGSEKPTPDLTLVPGAIQEL